MLRWGYKRVTVEDIARQAEVGKGTVYLHWKTRDALFEALMLRERAEVLRDLLRDMQRDATGVLPHRMMRATFLATMRRPLAKALYTRDLELLGKLAHSNNPAMQAQHMASTALMQEYLALLRGRGLMRADADLPMQLYALNATVAGFFLLEPFMDEQAQPSTDEKAEALALTVRRAFEPSGDPDPAALDAVAPTIIQLFDQLRTDSERQIQAQTES